MIDMMAAGRHVLASQTFSKLLGAELTDYSDNRVVMTLPLRPDFLQHNGFAHGGVLSSLADMALTFAGGLKLGPAVLTVEYKINYMRPSVGKALIGRAEVIYAGKTTATCRCDVFSVAEDGSEKVCAIAQGTIAKVG